MPPPRRATNAEPQNARLAAEIKRLQIERRQAEEALHAVEKLLRGKENNLKLIINTIPAMAWSTRPDGSADFFNQHYLNYVGLSSEEVQGSGWAVAVHPDDRSGLASTWQTLLTSGKPGEAEARLRRCDGVYRWFLFRANPLRDESDAIVKWYGTNTDIDDRKRAEEELRRNENFLAEGQRLSMTGSFVWQLDTDDITFSNELRRIFVLENEPVALESIIARVHPDDLPLVAEKVALARAGVVAHDYDARLTMPDGSVKHLRTYAHANRHPDGRLEFVGAMQDVTQHRIYEEALSAAHLELTTMARIMSFNTLTGSIAHEVNQPLAGIVTNASTCLRMLAATPPNIAGARETARRTIRDGNRVSDVISRLRVLFSRKEITSELVDLNEAAREVIVLSRREMHQSRVVVRPELADDLPPVMGDRIQLQQVMLNLVRNASDAMGDVQYRQRRLTIRTELEQDGGVRLVVKDVGVGIEPESLARLFEPFFTTKPNGMGIGLSVCRSIIESHHGRLWAEPNDGPGSTFAFSLPRALDVPLTP